MPLVSLYPKTVYVERLLVNADDEMRKKIQAAIWHHWEIPVNDIVINVMRCPYAGDPDKTTADVVVFIETIPDSELEVRADQLRHSVERMFSKPTLELGLSVELSTEIWIRFISGSWSLIKDGKVVDSDDHNKG